jgi:IS1 family transposase
MRNACRRMPRNQTDFLQDDPLTMHDRSSIIVSMNRLDDTKRAQIVAFLVQGNSIRSTVRLTGTSKNTVTKLLVDLGNACSSFHDAHVRNVSARRVQCDEIWSFCYGKDKNVAPELNAVGAGSVWTWTALDADSKLIISYVCGGRNASFALEFMRDLASRVTTRIQITSDGDRAYAEAVEGVFGIDVDYEMLKKLYGSPAQPAARYSPSVCIGAENVRVTGSSDPRHISTSFVERRNLTMRASMRRFALLTNGFSKRIENHEAMLAVYFAHYNFCRVRQTLTVTPAMGAGLTNHVWTIEELLTLVLSI